MTIDELDNATRGQINARRNFLIGLWAGRLQGLESQEMPSYVRSVMLSDEIEPGPNDVIRKIHGDLKREGVDIGSSEILRQLQACERSVRAELLATD